jgi:hypothetical protein
VNVNVSLKRVHELVLNKIKCHHSVCISLYNTLFCYTLPSISRRNYFVVFEMCQASLTRSVRSFSYNFSPVGGILQFSSSYIMHQVNSFALYKFLWRLVYQGREHHCSVCCYSSRCLFVSFMLQVLTHFSRYGIKFKTRYTTYRQYYRIDTWPRFW